VAGSDLVGPRDAHATRDQRRRGKPGSRPTGVHKISPSVGLPEAPSEVRDLTALHACTDDRKQEGGGRTTPSASP
jgi:hypothetical protein